MGTDRVNTSAARSASRCEFNVWVDYLDDEGKFVAYSGFAPGLQAFGSTVAEALTNFADGYANREDAR